MFLLLILLKKGKRKMNKLIPLEFNNQRIMTTRVLAEQFGTDDKIISQIA